jgi:hypothetical protein
VCRYRVGECAYVNWQSVYTYTFVSVVNQQTNTCRQTYILEYIYTYTHTYMHTHIQVAAEELVRCLREERARTLSDNVRKKMVAQILKSSLYSALYSKYTQATDFSEFLPCGQHVRARAPRGGGGHERRCQPCGMGAGV